jgi:UDP-N-acetylglucosamine 2-epimerase
MTAIAVARRRKVPSITALAGQIFDHPQYGELNADVIAVNNDSARDIFLRRGIAPERVVVTGMAHLDHPAESADETRENSQFGAKLIMFATENLPLGTTLRMITPVAKFVMDTPKTALVIRPHPREDPLVYADFVSSFGSDRVSLDATTPLPDLLAKSDVCVTGFSNVAVEAMMFNLPVICINLSANPDVLGYVEQNAALGVTEERRLPEVLNSALYDNGVRMALRKGRAEFLKKNVYAGDGSASVRIATLIEKMAREDQLNG